MRNEDISKSFREIAALLELKGESTFQARAYQRAADQIARAEDVSVLVREGRLTDLPGIGRTMADKVGYLLATGTVPLLEELRREVPPGLIELSKIPGLGPGRIRVLREKLGVESVEDLERAHAEGKLDAVPGMGAKRIADLGRALEQWRSMRGFRLYRHAREEADEIATILLEAGAEEVAFGGELARFHPIVTDINIIASSRSPENVLDVLGERWAEATREGDSLRFETGTAFPAGVRVVRPERFGLVVVRRSSAPPHWEGLLGIARDRGIRIDGDHLLRGEEEIPLSSEESVYEALGLPLLPPEIREGMGEIEAARAGSLPALLEPGDLRGILHVHSTWSDGLVPIREMAIHARSLGYHYLGIADHSKSAGYAGGLSAERLRAQGEEIEKLNGELAPFRIFRGVESDILADGSLDYDDDLLRSLDFVVASVHSRFAMEKEAQTARIVRAVRNPRTTILGHPSGRLLLAREPYDFDSRAVWEAARGADTVIELNAHEQRLDVDWKELPLLREMGLTIAICADAHDRDGLETPDLAVRIARKGWFGPDRVLNTLGPDEIAARFHRTVS